ncbi:phospholipase D-like domain-containing protein [Pseudopontixanthobacter vadosimaris]|uniref:phospholipase D-like domain-containing protein n=1 Tax=Pseudopontixanthobacter vadosimaris TaxID=2726450 RepID=UPI001475DA6E|nr:phospholipase D family protein [Pseudopontixanthobacter vadosimaris]
MAAPETRTGAQSRKSRTPPYATRQTALSSLGMLAAEEAVRHPGLSGVELLRDGIDAFAMRMWLLQRAEQAVDLQYYIWHGDMTGHLMLEELRKVAARGVRVRLLLDDNGIAGLDDTLFWLAGLPNIEIRLFNPFRHRRFKSLDFITDFARANRRMHSKSFTADNQVAIVGGRNIGDEYLAGRKDGVFADLDAVCAGPVVGDISDSFDRFWNSPAAHPVQTLVADRLFDAIQQARGNHRKIVAQPQATDYLQQVAESACLAQLEAGEVKLVWAPVTLISDPPEKVSQPRPGPISLLGRLTAFLGEAQSELLIVSGYFVPTREGARAFAAMARRGVDVRVLTNSYASTDVGAVHAGYAHRRKQLVEAGVRLFEMPAPGDRPKLSGKFVRGHARNRREGNGSTLHAKAFTVDGKAVFIGSFNFDPRSFALNTELGIVIENADLAKEMREAFDEAIAPNTYNVVSRRGRLGWIDQRDEMPEVEFTEPGTNWLSRLLVRALSRLPIEHLL